MPLSGRVLNGLLASLSDADFEELRPGLRLADFKYETVLVETGSPVARVYFPHSGIISLVVRLKTGLMVEAAMVGRDGVFGAGCAVSGRPALSTAIVQMDGKGSTIDAGLLRSAAAQSPTLLAALIQAELFVHAQALQSAACNASHTVEARLARWLLQARDLSGSDRLTFSQEFLAQMLGTHRNTVSLVAHTLQQAGLIRYSRGVIDIVDVASLLGNSCECYEAIKAIASGGPHGSQS
jgi:CRP-like cAMP-binding protein